MDRPLVTAVVLNYRSPRQTVACVHALLNQTISDNMDILVVDNHSGDDSVGILHNRLGMFPRVRVLETAANLGFGKGYDTGIRQAQSTYVLINNPDKILEPSGIDKMVQMMEQDSSIGIIGPKLVHPDGSVRLSPRAFPEPLDVLAKRTFLGRLFPGRIRRYLQLDRSLDETRDVEWIAGGCFLMRTDLLRKLEGFDPRFFLFFEDIDLCRRTWESGKRVVYCPEITGIDRKRRLSDMNALAMPFKRIGRIHIASAAKYFWKWRRKPLPGIIASIQKDHP